MSAGIVSAAAMIGRAVKAVLTLEVEELRVLLLEELVKVGVVLFERRDVSCVLRGLAMLGRGLLCLALAFGRGRGCWLLLLIVITILALELVHRLHEATIHEVVDIHAIRVARVTTWFLAARAAGVGLRAQEQRRLLRLLTRG